ncbi:MAG: hypothetical protein ACE5FP_00560 [Gemmatimonadota bacterium]
MSGRILGALLLTGLAAGFAWLNGGQRVGLHLGLFRVRSVSLAAVVFAAFLAGMLTLLLASLKSDLRTRRMLRRYRQALGPDSVPDPADAPDGS